MTYCWKGYTSPTTFTDFPTNFTGTTSYNNFTSFKVSLIHKASIFTCKSDDDPV